MADFDKEWEKLESKRHGFESDRNEIVGALINQAPGVAGYRTFDALNQADGNLSLGNFLTGLEVELIVTGVPTPYNFSGIPLMFKAPIVSTFYLAGHKFAADEFSGDSRRQEQNQEREA
ncbi:hypothetical protein COU62_01155 [Candidatus Pacearchaeota archaeon CG10_big_fil_rev_8_21_14_0_10_35_219]|nr:hypothetical protein [Candidatus Pacearchaeota archaeon]OIO43046.1 MAG: hypothetical protein AUJ63_01325 [Candidatus Pacearchaeota archaeon CG1_02_35_32]PIO08172.1 MAG: hypothetical protein COU62_01155 [Candidatus Pacearchaeota archaeon CG10_big_fil_rev_8_21_14_0_10_35_219]PIY81104.1 MAG: hypothetical protein COY79_04865 [Candidatus Pacearchaeota archaeon CG_4_10_14_0_8_um_filter_35_169]PIZ79753.1 MAG: hypothetical protein COY00_03400 [Candidatus Pacearchaeota archaeon CG_4_10_14_0_2_um_filt